MDGIVAFLPFPMVGLDTDNGGELTNNYVLWRG